MSNKLILLSNDDGISARGLQILKKSLSEIATLIVCAPATQQSAVGHGITLDRPLRIEKHDENSYAVNGKPADAVFLALGELCQRTPDLVISGINHGPNLGVDVMYSGTVAAAMEAAMRSIPAIAVSQFLPKIEVEGKNISPWHAPNESHQELDECFYKTSSFIKKLSLRLLDNPQLIPKDYVLNVNSPVGDAKGVVWTSLGKQLYQPRVKRQFDPRGVPYYWVAGEVQSFNAEDGTDISAIQNKQISLTLLDYNISAAIHSPFKTDGLLS